MSETQIKITESFQAVDDNGNEYHVVEHTLFRKTTTPLWHSVTKKAKRQNNTS
jgi:hypothetical protein